MRRAHRIFRTLAALVALLVAALLALALATGGLRAQNADRDAAPPPDASETGGLLVGFLERTLSGENRQIRVVGLDGALSARATIQELTVSDSEGVWLTITNAVLDWNRLALVRGRFSVNRLSAEEIIIARPPLPGGDAADLPSPEAKPFQVPELPVEIELGEIRVGRLDLGQPVLGVAAELAMLGRLRLADGALEADLDITRLDRAGDAIALAASFANETRQIAVDLNANEAAGGLIASMLGLPGPPPLRLTAKGAGPVSDFTADLALATEGTDRLAGQVRLRADPQAPAAGPADILFAAEIAGDVTPMLPATYHEFFGRSVEFSLAGRSASDGGFSLDHLRLGASALRLEGSLARAADGRLQGFALDAAITPPEGDTVALPLAGPPTEIRGARLHAGFDAAAGDGWQAEFQADGLFRPDMTLARAALRGAGTLDQDVGLQFSGQIEGALEGFDFTDPGLARAIGPRIRLAGGLSSLPGGRFGLSRFRLEGEDYGATLDVELSGLDAKFALTGDITAQARDLARFGALAGRDLSGAARATLSGRLAPLDGAFDMVLNATGQDLAAGIAQLDPLIAGAATLGLDAARGPDGISLRRFALTAPGLEARANGQLKSRDSRLELSARLPDLALALPQMSGPLSLEGTLEQAGRDWQGALTVDSADGLVADLDGRITDQGAADLRFDATLPGIDRLVPQLSGTLTASGQAARVNRGWTFDALTALTDGSRARVEGTFSELSGDAAIRLDGALIEVERFAPQITGTARLQGEALRADHVWTGRLETALPDGSRAELTGDFDELSGAADLELDAALRRLDQFAPQLAGSASLRGSATRRSGSWRADLQAATTAGSRAHLLAGFSELTGDADLSYDAALVRLERFVPQITGTAAARGSARRRAGAWRFDSALAGPEGSSANLEGEFTESSGDFAARFRAALARLDRFAPQLSGTLTAQGHAARSAGRWRAEARALGPAGSTLTMTGAMDDAAGTAAARIEAALQGLDRFAPQLQGRFNLSASAERADRRWTGQARADGPAGSKLTLSGTLEEDGAADLAFDAALLRLERFVPELPGSLDAAGTARRQGQIWQIDSRAAGPGGIDARLAGRYDQRRGTADLAADGQLRLDAANVVLAPNTLSGTARFDLALKGKPGLEALSGTISSSGAVFTLPALAQTLRPINATVTLGDGQAVLGVDAGLQAGGTIRVSGPVALRAPFDGQLAIALENLVLTDNLSFTSAANGALRFAGPLAGGATLSGAIEIGETDINLTAVSGAVGAAPIPDITHIGEPGPVHATRRRARLTDQGNGGTGAVYGLDLAINARNRIFVTGFGVNAELGGALKVGGTTARVEPSGQIEMIRGHMDILGRRLTLTRGLVTLAGDLKPYVEFESSTSTSDGQATIEIAGPVDAPEIAIYSEPERPSEEALAMLLFGNRFSELSPFVIAQMAASLAALGSGGGATEALRDGTGADTVDIGAGPGGTGRLGAGKYLSENVYTDFTVNTKGETELNLNLDVTESLSLRGTVDNAGDTGLGIYFKRDY